MGIVARNAGLFGLIGGFYAGGECLAENFRGKKDVWNGIYGGLLAGQVIAFKSKFLPCSIQ